MNEGDDMVPRPARIPSRPRLGALALCVALGLFAACKKAEEPAKPVPAAAPKPQAAAPKPQAAFRVTGVLIGNAIDADKKVSSPRVVFKPTDTFYASVLSAGAAPTAALAVRWTFEDGQVINESTQNIAPTGPAVTEFHVSKPDGWPAGKYKLEVLANGQPAQTLQFSVAD